MATRVRTIDFLPEIFKTKTNEQFLSATLDQLTQQPNFSRVQGFIGSKFGYGVNSSDTYVVEPNKVRTNYQLEPAIVFKKKDSSVAIDALTYPGLIDALAAQGAVTSNHNSLFNNEFYSWDSFVDLDKLINYHQYYWLPNGPDAVTLTTTTLYSKATFKVQPSENSFQMSENKVKLDGKNPIITLVRGGSYEFEVSQGSKFWIQTMPGVSGVDPSRPTVSTRNVFGVNNNGISDGIVAFEVPFANAQDEYDLPGDLTVNLATTLSFNEINGMPLNVLKSIDGVTDLKNKTLIFYGRPVDEVGYVSKFYDSGDFDSSIGTTGDFEDGTYTVVNENYYSINLLGDSTNPVVQLVNAGTLNVNEKITVTSGELYAARNFSKNSLGEIALLPVSTARLNTLYYQDDSNPLRVGKIKLVDDISSSVIDLDDIIGKKTYTSPNNITLTNGLKIQFLGNIIPETYKQGQYYVEGVGTSIALVPVDECVVPEQFGSPKSTPYDDASFDNESFGNAYNIPLTPDYITINRNSVSKNAWSRSNRWFHEQVLQVSIANNIASPSSSAALDNASARAKRPILEFYPNLHLFNSGVVGKKPVNFINYTVTDALSTVAGQTIFRPDGDTSILYEGARIIFANDASLEVRNKIFVANFIIPAGESEPVITLSTAFDGEIVEGDQVVITQGESNVGLTVHFDGSNWIAGQQKVTTNQPPKFDLLNQSGISFGNKDFYPSSDFNGCTLFEYAVGSGTDDPVLRFPIKYSSLSNLGDISFNVSLNTQTFNYVDGIVSTTSSVSSGYPYEQTTPNEYTRKLGWQTAVERSFQYQVFDFEYNPVQSLTPTFVCDVAALTDTQWIPAIVYADNQRIDKADYTVVVGANSTTITFLTELTTGTAVQVLVYSNQVSQVGYYQIPTNLDHNPFNEQLTSINLGDIRGHYKSILNNVNAIVGDSFGSNNYRDLGNLIPYGTRIIQSSAPICAAAAFLRNKGNNFFDALNYNAREYTKYKTLLVDTINRLDLDVLNDNSYILDSAIAEIANAKISSNPFFWSDMLPSGNTSSAKTYSFKNGLANAVFPLSRVYNFKEANYQSVLVYLTRKVDGTIRVTQLFRDVDYVVSTTEPSILMNRYLESGDSITVKEYSQTYGSYVPNTPSKLGLYPAFKPEVIYDTTYVTPSYFLKGHDGSYTKLYGEYNNGYLEDFRDRALLEFETRIYNNIKVDAKIPVEYDDIFPGQFRTTDYSYDEVKNMYSTQFLNWVGLNRIDYQSQYYDSTNEYTWNYSKATSKLDNKSIGRGNWRGVYLWLYDTATPNLTPWEMLGFSSKPIWWDSRYGLAPYTSENILLWGDISKGYVWNNGDPYINEKRVRDGLLSVLPVNEFGELKSPFENNVASYNKNTFKTNWEVGDVGPAEYSYLKSSTWPFDLMRLAALAKPARFFTLGLNLDTYRYNTEFNQYLVNDRFRSSTTNNVIYGTDQTTSTHSYINWLVDYAHQYGVEGSVTVSELLDSLDVRLTYRVAGFTDKDMLKFYVEKGSPNSKNSSLLIPDESYGILLYENQPNYVILYSSLIIQKTANGYKVYGNGQNKAYFTALYPINNGNYDTIVVNDLTLTVNRNYSDKTYTVPYGVEFTTVASLAAFIKGYGVFLETQGMQFSDIENSLELNWNQMIAELMYWIQSGWEVGSTVNINPCANSITVNKENYIVQPLTVQNQNFVLNQNLLPVQLKDMSIYRNDTTFTAKVLNQGDTISFFTANMSNIEHLVVFDNVTVFNDVLFNTITGLRQQRLYVKGSKTSEWTGSMNASGFIINQDNVVDWQENVKYPKGSIVKYKNSYWVSQQIAIPSNKFDLSIWIKTDYDKVRTGLLPNPSARAYESTLFYDANRTNLESDSDLLSFSLVGYRPRDYLVSGDLDDTSQVNVYLNMIGSKGTNTGVTNLNGINLQQNELQYTLHENWAIKTGEYGGILNQNFLEVTLDEAKLSGNPSIVSIVDDKMVDGAEQSIPLYNIKNYGRLISNSSILSSVDGDLESKLPSAGYVNLDDVRATGYTIERLQNSIVTDIYKNDYIWIAEKDNDWDVYTPESMGVTLISALNNLDGTVSFVFDKDHNLLEKDPFGVLNFDMKIDGFYTVSKVLDTRSVSVIKTLDPSVNAIASTGLPFKLQSQRVEYGKDIVTLSALANEYTLNKVWVDTGIDGTWVVYEKVNRYTNQSFTKLGDGTEFGSSVAYVPNVGYFVTDPAQNVMRQYRKAGNVFTLVQTYEPPIETTRYGTTIEYNDEFLIVSDSNPDAFVNDSLSSYMFVYRIVKDKRIAKLVLEQVESVGGTKCGDAMALTGDSNLLYTNFIDYGIVAPYQRDEDYVYDDTTFVLESATVVGASHFTVSGDVTTLIDEGKFVSFNNVGHETVYTIITATYVAATNSTTFYTVEQFNYSIPSGTSIYTASVHFSLIFVNISGSDYPDLITMGVNSADIKFGYSLATNYDGTKLFISAPTVDYSEIVQDIGAVYVYDRLVETWEMQYDGRDGSFAVFYLPWEPTASSIISVNGVRLQPDEYLIILNIVILNGSILNAGDLVTVSSGNFTVAQQLTAYSEADLLAGNVRAGEWFGHSIACNTSGSELIVGSPFDRHINDQEGAVYRFTNPGKRFGIVTGTKSASVPSNTYILINGYSVVIPLGNAATIASSINSTVVPNVVAEAKEGGILEIRLKNASLNPTNNKLDIVVFDAETLDHLGFTGSYYTNTQIITDPHKQDRSQFGYSVKFNKQNSFVVSAPVSDRYLGTTFDFTDDSNSHNDAVFDNNLTQWVDVFADAGSVYMFDYIPTYNESINNLGNYIYAQACNDLISDYGADPMYGTSLAFNDYELVIGTPNFKPNTVGGRVVVYSNNQYKTDWSISRQQPEVVDIEKVQKVQLYNNINDTMLEALDYFDPLQGKLLGAVRENIDYISPSDPASYTIMGNGNVVWNKAQLGKIWFDISSTKFVNYHQGDVAYDSKYWGQVFPGSEVSVYTWIESDVSPVAYAGPGTPYDLAKYSVTFQNDATHNLVPKFYYWVKNSNVFSQTLGKTLTDSVIQQYLISPQNSGISYLAPIKANTFALYNCDEFIRGTETNLHVGFSVASVDAANHAEFKLIRTNFANDFLPGIPSGNEAPSGLYAKLLDSLAGEDTAGAVVPDPFLPKMLQIGINTRPRQSLFANRFKALANYLTFANQVLSTYPVAETGNISFLTVTTDTVDTTKYWEHVYWWADGYDDSTRAAFDVSLYAELDSLDAYEGLIVGVRKNANDNREVYLYTSGAWTRIGVENGTIRFLDTLWDYTKNRIGFGDSFFDSVDFSFAPTIETRYIVRALNEQIYVGPLFDYRNQSLILLFEYIQSENIANNNYLPWLNKTSLADVGYTVRSLKPYQKYQQDNQTFVQGYVDEVKPYHVVIKEFSLRYDGIDEYQGFITDFDLPATYNPSLDKFTSPQLVQKVTGKNQYLTTDIIWSDDKYNLWYNNYGLTFNDSPNREVGVLAKYLSAIDNSLTIDNARGLPVQGMLRIDNELISYSSIDRETGQLLGLSRGSNGTLQSLHYENSKVYMDLPSVVVLDTGRYYTEIPTVSAFIDTTIYPAPKRDAILRAVISADKVIGVQTIDPGEGYVVTPEIVFDYSISSTFTSATVNFTTNTIVMPKIQLETGELVKLSTDTNQMGIVANGYYYVHVVDTNQSYTIVSLHSSKTEAGLGTHPVKLHQENASLNYVYTLGISARAVPSMANTRVRGITDTLRFDRTSYQTKISEWVSGTFWSSPYVSIGNDASSDELLYTTGNLTSSTGAVMPVISADANNDNTAVVTLDYETSGIKPGQIKGTRVFFYKVLDPYIYDDAGTPPEGLTLDVTVTSTDVTSAVINNGGTNYKVNDVISITGYGDAQVTVTSIGALGVVTGITISQMHTDLPISNGTVTGVETTIFSAPRGAVIEVYRPSFNPESITNEYTIKIVDPGSKYNDGDKIVISGNLLGGKVGVNDLIITILFVTGTNGIYLTKVKGIAVNSYNLYYLNPVSDTTANVYYDPNFARAVPFSAFDYTGVTPDVDYAYAIEPIIAGPGYKFDTTSMVAYNGKVWRCLESNNDATFDYNKWEEVPSGDRSLNALDRIFAYYQPTVDMPGRDITQLVKGVTNPNPVYYGNTFAPEEELPIDYILQDNKFYPRDVSIKGIVFDGTRYIAIGDSTEHSVVLIGTDGQTWDSYPISTKVLNVTGITWSGDMYTISTSTPSVPVLVSFDAENWVSVGNYSPFDLTPWDRSAFGTTELECKLTPQQSTLTVDGINYLVGNSILRSENGISWAETFSFGSRLSNTLNAIAYVDITHYTGFIAVGGGDFITQDSETSSPVVTSGSRILNSFDGVSWSLQQPSLTGYMLNAVTSSSDIIVIAGEEGQIWYSINGYNWSTATTVGGSVSTSLRSIAYGNNKFVIVGDNGTVLKSTDGMSWTDVSGSYATTNLKQVIFDGSKFIAVGEYDTVLTSTDTVTWVNQSAINPVDPEFTIKGSDFLYGYGPEELVAGVITDTLSLTVKTAPGSYWDNDTESDFWYYNTGFNMVYSVGSPDESNTYSFDGLVVNPAQLSVFIVQTTTSLSTRIYENVTTTNNTTTYTVDWIAKTVTLNQALSAGYELMVEVYEVGNGRQIARGNSQNTSLRLSNGNSYFLIETKYQDLVTDPVVFVNGSKLEYGVDYSVTHTTDNLYQIVFNTEYTQSDYVTYALLASTITDYNTNQYGYSIPETEVFLGSGDSYTLNATLASDAEDNMIVEVNGIRLASTGYNLVGQVLTTTASYTSSDLVAVTTFNDTQRQWLKTVGYTWSTSAPYTVTSPSVPYPMPDIVYTDANRFWVTVNGKRVLPNMLSLGTNNALSILSPVSVGDKVVITAMVSGSTPNETSTTMFVDKNGNMEICRTNPSLTTWLVQDLSATATVIYVNDASKLGTTNILVVGSERIRFNTVNLETNTITDLVRGIQGTPISAHDMYTQVYSVDSNTKLADIYVNLNWNSDSITGLGDPMQISTTTAASFLNGV